jgi:uncharacterized protein YndB with AHSA1/START domain
MRFYETTQTIDAAPEDVWEVLSDGPGFVDWNSGIVKFDGTIGLGNKIKLFSEVSPEQAFPLKVTEMEPGRRLVFAGGMPLGLFKGVRTYTLTPEASRTRFHMREEFSGPLLNMIWKSMPDLQPSFDKFAAGLKSRIESN